MEILKLTEFHSLLSTDVLTNATVIKAYERKLHEDRDCACCSCERLFVRSDVTRMKLSDEMGSEVWPRLKAFVMKHNITASSDVLYMCKYCKPRIKNDELPARCVLRGLETVYHCQLN